MERTLKQYDKEYLKIAMLKHEETFRQQVHELHRLYRKQMLLMRDVKSMEQKKQRTIMERWNHREFDLELPAEAFIKNGEKRDSINYNSEYESNLELTLAIGSSQRKTEETQYTTDSGASFSSSSTESGNRKVNKEGWGLYQAPELCMGFRNERKSGFDQNIEQSPWLFQCLSLNMT